MPEFLTIDICKEFLAMQEQSYTKLVKMLAEYLRNEIRLIRNEVNDLKVSAQFQSNTIDGIEKAIKKLNGQLRSIEESIQASEEYMEAVDDKMEYLENTSRRNNIKVIGIVESPNFIESWDESETIVKDKIKSLLSITEDLEIERAHRVGRPKEYHTRADGSKIKARPRPIVVKFLSWKQKEPVVRKAREVTPPEVKFLADLSQRSLKRRQDLVPKLLEARRNGKVAYFIGDRLVVKDKGGNQDQRPKDVDTNVDDEVSFTLS